MIDRRVQSAGRYPGALQSVAFDPLAETGVTVGKGEIRSAMPRGREIEPAKLGAFAERPEMAVVDGILLLLHEHKCLRGFRPVDLADLPVDAKAAETSVRFRNILAVHVAVHGVSPDAK